MKLKFLYILLLGMLFTACKTEFERTRTSNDPTLILSKADGYYAEGDFYRAQTLYDIIIPFYRGKSEAESLFLKYAYCNYNQAQYLLANHYFENYASTFTSSANREEATFMTAYSLYELSPNYKLDQTYTEQSIKSFQKFINTYPNSERVGESNNLIDEMRAKLEVKAFEQGVLYYNIKDYKAAISSLNLMVKDYPETKRITEIRWLVLDSSRHLAENSVFSKKDERYNETLKLAERFIRKYPDSEYIAEANRIKEICLKSLKEIQNVRLEE
jgi:outer membrane protein assembly factor BamD